MNHSRLVIRQATDRLPSPNGVALAIMDIWDKDNTSLVQVANLVETDPALSGRLLKLANATAHGVREAASIREAIVRIGMRTVGQVAIAFSLVDQSREGSCEAFDYPAFWSESLLMATIAREIAKSGDTAPPDDLFACGLLARIGKLALATVYPVEYADIIESRPESMIEAEQARFGFNYTNLSYELMRDYGVPDALASPAVCHEQTDQLGAPEDGRFHRIAATLHIAWELSRSVKAGAQSSRSIQIPKPVADLARQTFGMEWETLCKRLDSGISAWKEWSKLLDLPSETGVAVNKDAAASVAETPKRVDETPDEDPTEHQYTALVLADREESGNTVNLAERCGFLTTTADSYEAVLRHAVMSPPDLIIIDQGQIPEDVEDLCRVIRSTEWGQPVYIMVIAQSASLDGEQSLFEIGVDAVVSPEISSALMMAKMAPAQRLAEQRALWVADRKSLRKTANELAISRRKFEVLSLTDQLTELPNRRAGMESLERSWAHSVREDTDLGILMMDIDRFKQINDRFGHPAGDHVLIRIAKAWSKAIRTGDMLCRSGGEEFFVVAKNTDVDGMIKLAKRLKIAAQHASIEWQGQHIPVSASFGMSIRRESADVESLLNTADKTLYVAKSKGRDRICYRDNGQYRLSTLSN